MDDFSFPTIALDQDPLCQLPFPHFATSPLWFFSKVCAAGDIQKSLSFSEDALTRDAGMKRENNPWVDSADGSRRFVYSEERMDMLWEDFNDEVGRGLCDPKRLAKKGSLDSSVFRRNLKTEQQLLAETKSSSLVHRGRPSLVLMVKVLKKLLPVQKVAPSKKQPDKELRSNVQGQQQGHPTAKVNRKKN